MDFLRSIDVDAKEASESLKMVLDVFGDCVSVIDVYSRSEQTQYGRAPVGGTVVVRDSKPASAEVPDRKKVLMFVRRAAGITKLPTSTGGRMAGKFTASDGAIWYVFEEETPRSAGACVCQGQLPPLESSTSCAEAPRPPSAGTNQPSAVSQPTGAPAGNASPAARSPSPGTGLSRARF